LALGGARTSIAGVFGRYPLPLWRKIVGLILVMVFVWNFDILVNQFLDDTFGGPGGTWCYYCQADPVRTR
jgi:hypothetical protein